MKAYEQIAKKLRNLRFNNPERVVEINIEGDGDSSDGILLVVAKSYIEGDEPQRLYKVITLSNSFQQDGVYLDNPMNEFTARAIQEHVQLTVMIRRGEYENPNIKMIVLNEAHGINKLTPVFNIAGFEQGITRKDLRELSSSKWSDNNAIPTKIKMYLDKNEEKFSKNVYESIRSYLIENLDQYITEDILFSYLDAIQLNYSD